MRTYNPARSDESTLKSGSCFGVANDIALKRRKVQSGVVVPYPEQVYKDEG
jgi:hypothetical protein